MKNIIILFIVFISLLSCNAKDKVSTAEAAKNDKEIKIGKNTLIWSQIEPLPDYSYKNYQIEPFLSLDYKMPIEIGSEWLVLYHTIDGKEQIMDLKLYQIQDSICVSLITENTDRLYNSPYEMDDSMSIPVFDVPNLILTKPEEMIFFKGFDKYNINFANDYINEKFSDYYIPTEGGKDKPFWILHYDFKYDGKPFSFQDTYIESDLDVIIKSEENNKEYAHYIVFKNENQSQCLIYRQADGEILNSLGYWDLDGDKLPDLIFYITYNITKKDDEFRIYSSYSSYLLFLSSEAEEGELVKHVATKTILNSRDVYPIIKE